MYKRRCMCTLTHNTHKYTHTQHTNIHTHTHTHTQIYTTHKYTHTTHINTHTQHTHNTQIHTHCCYTYMRWFLCNHFSTRNKDQKFVGRLFEDRIFYRLLIAVPMKKYSKFGRPKCIMIGQMLKLVRKWPTVISSIVFLTHQYDIMYVLFTVCSERSAFSEILFILSNNSSIVLYASSSAWDDIITMVTQNKTVVLPVFHHDLWFVHEQCF